MVLLQVYESDVPVRPWTQDKKMAVVLQHPRRSRAVVEAYLGQGHDEGYRWPAACCLDQRQERRPHRRPSAIPGDRS